MKTLTERVESVLRQFVLDPQAPVEQNWRLSEDLHIDSLDKVELVMELEDEFAIQIDDETAAGLKTVRDIVDLVTRDPATV